MTNLRTINPNTEQVIATYDWMSNKTIAARLDNAAHSHRKHTIYVSL